MSCETNSGQASAAAGPSGGITLSNSKAAFAAGAQVGKKAMNGGAAAVGNVSAATANYISTNRAYRIGRAVGKVTFAPWNVTQKIGTGAVKGVGKGIVGAAKFGLGTVKNVGLFTAGVASASPAIEETANIAKTVKGATDAALRYDREITAKIQEHFRQGESGSADAA